MKIPPQLIMLAVVGVTGSVLFAAQSDRQAQLRAVAMAPKAEVDPDKKLPNATDEVTGKPGDAAKSDASKPDASKTGAAKADPTADPAKSDAAKAEAAKDSTAAQAPADKAGEKSAADKGAATAKSGPTPQRFVPSEEVRADFDVSFPVDI
jgi:hypothetical protein